MVIKDSKWLIVKDIPINRGADKIKAGGVITVSHGTIYLNGGMLPLDYQQDFKELIMNDNEHKYVRPYNDIVGKPIIGDVDLDF